MNIIKSFSLFLEEAGTKVTTMYHYSTEFREIIKALAMKGDEVCQKLLGIEASSVYEDDKTLIDVTDKNDTVSFIQTNRLKRIKDQSLSDDDFDNWVSNISEDPDFIGWKNQRTDISFGRFIGNVFQKFNTPLTDKDRESAVNSYKSEFDNRKGALNRFEIVKGEEIRKWYLESNYQYEIGQLSNSCMRYPKCQSYLDIYVLNPDVCQLIILHANDSDKIIGRALLWKTENNMKYMDRIYTAYDSDMDLFRKFGEKIGVDKHRGNDISKLSVKLNSELEYEKMPYMDSFYIFDSEESKLYTNSDYLDSTKFWELRQTDGSWVVGGYVWSEYHGDSILRDGAVRCNNGDWVLSDCAHYMNHSDIWASPDEDVCYSGYVEDYYFGDEVVYSETLRDYLPKDLAILAYTSESTEDYLPYSYVEKQMIKTINIGGENKVCYLESLFFNPITKQYEFKLDKFDAFMEKIGDLEGTDFSKLWDFLRNKKADEKLISHMISMLPIYRMTHNTFFEITKLTLWNMRKKIFKGGGYNWRDKSEIMSDLESEESIEFLGKIMEDHRSSVIDSYFRIMKNLSPLIWDSIIDNEEMRLLFFKKMNSN